MDSTPVKIRETAVFTEKQIREEMLSTLDGESKPQIDIPEQIELPNITFQFSRRIVEHNEKFDSRLERDEEPDPLYSIDPFILDIHR